MKILVTGTHFTVASAVIAEFKRNPKHEIIYVGRDTTREGDPTPSQESIEFPKMGIKFIPITAGRLQRSFTRYTLPSLLKVPIGFTQAFFILQKVKADVVLSFGGYVALPLVFWAWVLSIPVIIHEQTLITGLANKISSIFADKIAVSFDCDYSFNREKVILTGNPIRKEILEVKRSLSGRPLILITGGNQGSHVINMAVLQCLDELTKLANVIHQTGDSKFRDFERLKNKQNKYYKVYKWLDMAEVLPKVDLVIGRAGINILSELAYLGIPALVIPIPYLYGDEQNINAKYFEKLGLVRILPQSRLSSKSLLEDVKDMMGNLKTLNRLAEAAKEVIIPDAARKVALETIILGSEVM